MNKRLFDELFEQLSARLSPTLVNRILILLESNYTQNNEIQSYKPALFSIALSEINESDIVLISRKLLLTGFILKNWVALSSSSIGLTLQSTYLTYLNRVSLMVTHDDDTLGSIDIFWKELAIARLQFYPVHSGVVELYSGFGIRQGLSLDLLTTGRFCCFLFQFGRKPYYQIHTHTPTLHHFSAEGWATSYHQVAEMLKENLNIRGVVRGSWFFDPKIKKISPRLSYLQDLPLQNGAQTFCSGEDYSGSAIATSKTRLKLYNEGKYTPMNYLLVWPRDAIIAWSEKHKP